MDRATVRAAVQEKEIMGHETRAVYSLGIAIGFT